MPFVNFLKKFRFFSIDFRQNFRGDRAYAEPNFFDELFKICLLKILLIICGNDFIAC